MAELRSQSNGSVRDVLFHMVLQESGSFLLQGHPGDRRKRKCEGTTLFTAMDRSALFLLLMFYWQELVM